MNRLPEAAKAFAAAALGAGVAAYVTAAAKGQITQNDIYVIVGAALVAGIGVFFVPNRPAPTATVRKP